MYLCTFTTKIQASVSISYRCTIPIIFAPEDYYELSFAIKCCLATLLYFCTPLVQRHPSVSLSVRGRGCMQHTPSLLQRLFRVFSLWHCDSHPSTLAMKKRSVSLHGEPTTSLSRIFANTQDTWKQLLWTSLLQPIHSPPNVPQYKPHPGQPRKTSSGTSKMLQCEAMKNLSLTAAQLQKINQN